MLNKPYVEHGICTGQVQDEISPRKIQFQKHMTGKDTVTTGQNHS